MLLKEIKKFVDNFIEEIRDKQIQIISHFDTDGITSAAIFSKTLERLNKQFSIKIILNIMMLSIYYKKFKTQLFISVSTT